jgi:hypothetical protein
VKTIALSPRAILLCGAATLLLASNAEAADTCFGLPFDDPGVCSGHDVCVAPDTCACDVGYVGSSCESSAAAVPTLSGRGHLAMALAIVLAGTVSLTRIRRSVGS